VRKVRQAVKAPCSCRGPLLANAPLIYLAGRYRFLFLIMCYTLILVTHICPPAVTPQVAGEAVLLQRCRDHVQRRGLLKLII
jgi:hypothetical protein